MVYRVGVIGCGRKGTQHARAWQLNPNAEVVAATDTDPENLQLFKKRFGVPTYTDYQEMLRNENIDIAAPILPVKPNHEVVMGCTAFDLKGILCEKPITDSLANADEMVEACRRQGIKFGCGDLDRNLPDYWEAKQYIDSGAIGDVVSIDIHMGFGAEWDIQSLSIMRMFASDAEVAWVIGWVDGDPMSDEDQGQAGYIRFVNGIEAFRHRNADAKSGIEVNCAKGAFHTDFSYLSLWRTEDSTAARKKTSGPPRLTKVEGVLDERYQHEGSGELDEDGWRWAGNRNIATVQSIIDAIESDVEPPGSGENSRKCLEIAIALRESHRQGHVPVQLPLTGRSLKITPPMSRWLDKKQTVSIEDYRRSIGGWRPGDV